MSREVVYGRNPVREALRGPREVSEVLVAGRAAQLDWLEGISVKVVEPRLLDQIAETNEHQGVVARVAPFRYADADALAARDRALIVALDEITDPQNLGAIVRVAECAGADGVVLPRHRSASVTGAVCKASAGAVEHLAVAIVPNLSDWLVASRRPGLWSYATAADGEQTHTQADLYDGAVIVIGSEGRGVRPRVRSVCDGSIHIPMQGRISSLNASVAAAIVLFEAQRQRQQVRG